MPDGRVEISANLFPGSWRGIPIYIPSGNVQGGRKATARPILNSDEQDVSDTGKKQRNYSLQAFVTARYGTKLFSDSSGISSDYTEQRARILAALEEKGVGILVHPFEGEIRDLVVQSFTLDETINEAGIGRLSIQFLRKTVGAVPAEEQGSAEEVSKFAEVVELSFTELIELAWGVDLSFIDAFEDALEKVQAAYQKVQDVVETVENVAADINGFSAAISGFVADAASIITAPLAIADSIKGLFAAINTIFPTLVAAFDAMVAGFDFGDLDIEFDVTTPSGKQKKRNFDVMNSAMQGIFLARAYDAATGIDLSTLERINEVEAILDAQHRKMVDGEAVDPESKSQLEDMRTAFFAFLADAKLTALKLSTETVAPATPRVLAYQFYAEDDLDSTLSAINGVESYELISGEAQVLTR